MPSWPGALPQAPSVDGFSKKLRNNTITTQTAQGYQRRRRRFTGKIHDVLITLPPITTTQLAAFNTFYNDTLETGTLEFDWYDFATDPRDAVTYRFGEVTPEVSALTPGSAIEDAYWRVSFSLELRS